MSPLAHRTTRMAWTWCVAYTAAVPPARRERRRLEVLSHLWLSEQSALAPRAVLWATARGAADDVTWAFRVGGRRLLAAPGTWLAVAPCLPVTAWAISAVGSQSLGNRVQLVATVGSLSMLAVSALLWLRHRS